MQAFQLHGLFDLQNKTIFCHTWHLCKLCSQSYRKLAKNERMNERIHCLKILFFKNMEFSWFLQTHFLLCIQYSRAHRVYMFHCHTMHRDSPYPNIPLWPCPAASLAETHTQPNSDNLEVHSELSIALVSFLVAHSLWSM